MAISAIQEAAEAIRHALANGSEVHAYYVSSRKFDRIKREASEMSILPRKPGEQLEILGVPVLVYDEKELLSG